MVRNLEIMDTTLRDGEQTSGVSYSPNEKLTIAKLLLDELNIDRIEVASARVSDGELNSVKQITNWAKENKKIDRIEVLTFLDNGKSLEWLIESGCNVQNLLTKGSLNHLKHQLKKTPSDHFKDISKIIQIAEQNSIQTNVYLEDWSNGMKNSKEYVFEFLDFLNEQKIKRILLPDTLGILTHYETYNFIKELPVSYLHVFTYSERQNTKAILMDGKVEIKEKKRRSSMLRILSEKKKNEFYRKMIGKDLQVLFEDTKKDEYLFGYSSNYVRVKYPFKTDLANSFKLIKIANVVDNICVD
jgi:hypothetical protein